MYSAYALGTSKNELQEFFFNLIRTLKPKKIANLLSMASCAMFNITSHVWARALYNDGFTSCRGIFLCNSTSHVQTSSSIAHTARSLAHPPNCLSVRLMLKF